MLELPNIIADMTIREAATEGFLPSEYLANGNPKPMADVWHTFTIDEQEQIVERVEMENYESEWLEMEAAAY